MPAYVMTLTLFHNKENINIQKYLFGLSGVFLEKTKEEGGHIH
jgi:hypothetical protein